MRVVGSSFFLVLVAGALFADASLLRKLPEGDVAPGAGPTDATTTPCGTMTCRSDQVCASFTGVCEKESPACTKGQVASRWTGSFKACIDAGQCGMAVDDQDPGYVPSTWQC